MLQQRQHLSRTSTLPAVALCIPFASVPGRARKVSTANGATIGFVRQRRASTTVEARDPAFDEVTRWVEYHGGHINPKLDVAVTDLGCRGVVAASTLSVTDQERPVMMIPGDLCISSDPDGTAVNMRLLSLGLPATWWADAAASLTQQMSGSFLDRVFARQRGGGQDGQQTLPGMTLVTDQLLVAMMLAYEKNLGPRSQYDPFVSGLEAPTCGFSLADEEIRAVLGTSADERDVQGITGAMHRARDDYEQAIAIMSPLLEAAEVSRGEMSWALQHVLSRALSNSKARVCLIPAIDYLNHSSDSCPAATVRGVTTCYFNMDRGCALRGLSAGQELFLHYAARSSQEDSPLKFFLRFAFVPAECWSGRSELPSMMAFQRSVQEKFASVL